MDNALWWWVTGFRYLCIIWSLSSVLCIVVTDLSGFVAIFKKTFVLKLYNELRHVRTTRDWNLTCCESSILIPQCASSDGLEWCDATSGLWDDAWVCLALFPGGAGRGWAAGAHQTVFASACRTWAVHQRGVGSQPLSAASVPFWPCCALPFPIAMFSPEFCAGSLRRTDGCVWSLLLLGRMWEKGCGERRMCAAL